MISDGTKAKDVDETVQTRDVAEVLEESIFGAPEKEDQPA